MPFPDFVKHLSPEQEKALAGRQAGRVDFYKPPTLIPNPEEIEENKTGDLIDFPKEGVELTSEDDFVKDVNDEQGHVAMAGKKAVAGETTQPAVAADVIRTELGDKNSSGDPALDKKADDIIADRMEKGTGESNVPTSKSKLSKRSKKASRAK